MFLISWQGFFTYLDQLELTLPPFDQFDLPNGGLYKQLYRLLSEHHTLFERDENQPEFISDANWLPTDEQDLDDCDVGFMEHDHEQRYQQRRGWLRFLDIDTLPILDNYTIDFTMTRYITLLQLWVLFPAVQQIQHRLL